MLNATEETTNNADFDLVIEAVDADTKEHIDFSGGDIVVAVRDGSGAERLRASTQDATVEILDVGIIGVSFLAEQMRNLRPATYKIGAVCKINNKTFSIFIGSVVVVDGVAFT